MDDVDSTRSHPETRIGTMTLQELVRNKAVAWTWAMDWADQGGAGARQLREKTESEAWNALLSAEGRKDTIGLFSPLAQAVAEYMSHAYPVDTYRYSC